MKNVTLALDEKLIEESRHYARAHHTSLNTLSRDLLGRTVLRENRVTGLTHVSRRWIPRMAALAVENGNGRIYEMSNHGQIYDSVQALNPFL